MSNRNPINWFELPVSDMPRAKGFYEHILQCELSLQELGPLTMAWFPSDREAPGATGALVLAESYEPSHAGSMLYFSVDNIEETLSRIESHGGKIINPKQGIGEYGFVAHFEDCEGNRVALHANQ